MKRPSVLSAARLLALLGALSLAACSSLEMPGTARYYSNQPGGPAFFKIGSGLGGPTLSARKDDSKWTKPRPMKALGPGDPPLSTTPGLAEIVESAHQVDTFIFLEFKPDAKLHGQPVASRYFLLPGGFAYPVQPTGR